VSDLFEGRAKRRQAACPIVNRAAAHRGAAAQFWVVDDSITTAHAWRKNILEARRVLRYNTAIHGLEALDILGDKPCGLVVADIRKCRYNGLWVLKLTARIRHSDDTSQLPVISGYVRWESAESKEPWVPGLAATAYIAKGKVLTRANSFRPFDSLIGRRDIRRIERGARPGGREDSLNSAAINCVPLIDQTPGMAVVGQARDGLEALVL